MRCYAVLDTFREFEAFSDRAVYRHSEEFRRSLNITKLVESGVRYSLLILLYADAPTNITIEAATCFFFR